MWEMMSAYRVLVEKPEGKGPLGRSRRMRVDNNKMDLTYDETVWAGFMWLRIWTSGGLL
jgi:hypothetical protein